MQLKGSFADYLNSREVGRQFIRLWFILSLSSPSSTLNGANNRATAWKWIEADMDVETSCKLDLIHKKSFGFILNASFFLFSFGMQEFIFVKDLPTKIKMKTYLQMSS